MNREESAYLLRDIKNNNITDNECLRLFFEQFALEKEAFEYTISQLNTLLDNNQIDHSHVKSPRAVSDDSFSHLMAENSGVCGSLYQQGKLPLPFSFRRTILKHMQ